jgi:hypothetical protein
MSRVADVLCARKPSGYDVVLFALRLLLLVAAGRKGPAPAVSLSVMTWAFGVLLCGIAALGVRRAASAAEDDRAVLARVKEAAIAVRMNLQTGCAEAALRIWRDDNPLTQNIYFGGAFDGSKDYLKLAYEPRQLGAPSECDRRIVVCDGSDLFVSRFSQRIHPAGADASVYDRPEAIDAATNGFPGGLKMFAQGILSPETLDKYPVTMQMLPDGHYRGEYEVTADYHTTFEIAPESTGKQVSLG